MTYARSAHKELADEAGVCWIEAETKIGEELARIPKARAGRPKIGSDVEPIFRGAPTLAEMDIGKKQSARVQKLYALGDEMDDLIGELMADLKPVSPNSVLTRRGPFPQNHHLWKMERFNRGLDHVSLPLSLAGGFGDKVGHHAKHGEASMNTRFEARRRRALGLLSNNALIDAFERAYEAYDEAGRPRVIEGRLEAISDEIQCRERAGMLVDDDWIADPKG